MKLGMKRNPRMTASSLTRTVLDRSLFINELLNDTLSAFDYPKRRFITELVYGTVRNLKHVDFWISKAFKKPLKRIDPTLLSLLRTSTYQMIFTTGREPALIVNETTELSKKVCSRKASGFINFILRDILRTGPTKENMEEHFGEDRDKFLQTYYSQPQWLFERLKKIATDDNLETYLENINKPLGITLRVEGEDTRDKVMESLISKGAKAVKAKDCVYGIYTHKAVNYAMVEEFENVYIQDESSQLAVYEMGIEKGDQVLDLCAAPGGKTLFASYLTGDTGSVTAVDVNRHKLEILTETAIKYKKKNIEIKLHDSTVLNPQWEDKFDKVLLDAPCSALGTIRRHPEVKWLKKDTDALKMATLASQILERASKYVKKDGILMFSVCTFTTEETTEQIQNFLIKHPEYKIEVAYNTVSSIHDQRDTFFICKLRRIK